MELILTRQNESQVQVTCDGLPSHSFDLHSLIPSSENQQGLPHPLEDPVTYGKAVYQALFPAGSPAQHTFAAMPDRILLVTTDNDIDAIPWEYAHGPDGFLVADYPFARGLPLDQRITTPILDRGLHIVAIPSDPLDKRLNPLNIEGEWMRLKEAISQLPNAVTLERTYPPTIEQLRSQVANRRHRVVHFMGHGGQDEVAGAFLYLEQENDTLDPVTAKQFVQRVRGSVFLVTLNACVSATPGPTQFSNLAAALVRQKVPYALGMRMSIHDDDALAFTRRFYSELASGVPVEEALFQARLTLADSPRKWAIGVPVLYTALSKPAGGYAPQVGAPIIEEHRPPVDVIALPRAEGSFQGHIDELVWLGDKLTGHERPQVITIHGSGGQGKTALAREAVERFAFAWPGGIWASSLENLPSREVFITNLAQFLGIPAQDGAAQDDVERQVLLHLSQGQPRTLIVLDNVETLIEAVNANDLAAIALVQFIREHLIRPPVSLLVISRSFLGWQGELGLELEGLHPDEGAKLFQQSAPRRSHEIEPVLAEELSRKVAGHPLSLRLLGGVFNQMSLSLAEFLRDYDAHLLAAEDRYIEVGHRLRTLYACIETSVRYLDAALLHLFSKLWIFHAPFLPETAVDIFDPEFDETKGERSLIYDQLHALWLRGLLTRGRETLREGTLEFYSLPPTMRPYIEVYLARAEEREELLAHFGAAYARLARFLRDELDRRGTAAFIAEQCREDLERGVSYVMGVDRGYYLLNWGWVLLRTGYTERSLELTEQALEIGQGQDQSLELLALNNLAYLYVSQGKYEKAEPLHQQTMPILEQQIGPEDLATARSLNNLASLYVSQGKYEKAEPLHQRALAIREQLLGPLHQDTIQSLNNLADLYIKQSKYIQAEPLFQRALYVLGPAHPDIIHLNNKLTEFHAKQTQKSEALRFFAEAGFSFIGLDEPIDYLANPTTSFWQKKIKHAAYMHILTGKSLTGKDVLRIHDAARVQSDDITLAFAVVDKPVEDQAWLQIAALRANNFNVIPIPFSLFNESKTKDRKISTNILLDKHIERFLGQGADPYNVHHPVFDVLNFFGREGLANDLIEQMNTGQSIGLFGLRKIGKSSLMRYMQGLMPCPTARLDLQAGIELTGLYERLLHSWGNEAMTRFGTDLGLSDTNLDIGDPTTEFVKITQATLDRMASINLEARLAIFLDEIELVMPGPAATQAALEQYLSLTRTLRGLVQEDGRILLMVAGIDPTINRVSRLGEEQNQNPFFMLLRELYLPPLFELDCIQMIRNIGTQVKLSYSEEAATYIAQMSGGHPYLARQLCSLAYTQRHQQPGEVTRSAMQQAVERFLFDPKYASCLNASGLWGEVTNIKLWGEQAARANQDILFRLARSREPIADSLITQGVDQVALRSALFSLTELSVIHALEDSPELDEPYYVISFGLFHSWIRRIRLGLKE